ncbi:MAG: response regulator [Allosphingosinicella sp.]
MIIEDQFLVAAQIEDVLREMGYSEFDFADSERDALQAARANCPDLITADQRLIEGTGLRAVAAICAEHGDIPTVYITAFQNEVREVLPAAVIVRKPFGSRLLQEAVARAIVLDGKVADAT